MRDEHLGCEKHSPTWDLIGNSSNGNNQKTIQTEMGKTKINVARDRNGEFNPELIRKYQTKSNDLEKANHRHVR